MNSLIWITIVTGPYNILIGISFIYHNIVSIDFEKFEFQITIFICKILSLVTWGIKICLSLCSMLPLIIIIKTYWFSIIIVFNIFIYLQRAMVLLPSTNWTHLNFLKSSQTYIFMHFHLSSVIISFCFQNLHVTSMVFRLLWVKHLFSVHSAN